jgi:hypothetical protein
MIYLVECDFTDAAREAEWNEWYSPHLNDLLSIPGFSTAQRLRALGDGAPRYRALYAVESPEIFTSPGYVGRSFGRFPDRWRALITNWRRNLLDGLNAPPDVGFGQCLVTVEPPSDIGVKGLHLLEGVGLDKSIARLGLGVVTRAEGEALAARKLKGVVVSEPLTPRLVKE